VKEPVKKQMNFLANNTQRKEKGKMKRLTGIFVAGLVVFGLAGIVFAQTDSDNHDVYITVNAIAKLAISGGDAAIAVDDVGITAGEDPHVTEDATTYLQYTSIVASGSTRTLTAQTDGNEPAGCELKASAVTGGGNQGSGLSDVALNDLTAEEVVTGISTCATGTGGTDGANITYGLNLTLSSLLETASTAVQVTWTLTDDS
jgi:hypothetical protein